MSVDTTNATAAAGVEPSRVRIAGAIKQAAGSTGISFEYLLATAKMESNFNPAAGASTSSAHGLFQFIDQTWLGTVKEAGAQLGYGKYADAITKSSGSYSVNDPAARAAILKLRDDPAAASAMAAVLTQSNSFKLTGKIGRRHPSCRGACQRCAGFARHRQRRLSFELSGRSLGHSGRDGVGVNCRQLLSGRADIPLAVPGRRTDRACLASGS